MFVHTIKEKKTGRVLMFYYDYVYKNGKSSKSPVERIGYVDEFYHLSEDPLAHFRRIAKERTALKKSRTITLTQNLDEEFTFDNEPSVDLVEGDLLYNYGVLPLLQLYRELEIDYFLNSRRQNLKVKYNHNHIFQMLVFGRIISPASKLATWKKRMHFLHAGDFSDDDVYRSLEFFAKQKDDLIAKLHSMVKQQYGRDTSLMYYDVTNYYWELDGEDDLRKRGVSKEHRPEPIVQMGLFMDKEGLPVTYGLFPGNTNDVLTMRPMMDKLIEGLGCKSMIYVADKAMMSALNIAQITLDNNGYVISSSVRKATEEQKKYILDDSGYTYLEENSYKYKSRLVPRELKVETADGRIVTVTVNERQIIFWSEKYQKKAAHERERSIVKALTKATSGYNSVVNNYGANRYIKKVIHDSDTGNTVEKPEFALSLNQELIASEEALDGYYMIRTNVVGLLDSSKPMKHDSRWHAKEGLLELNREVSDQDIIDMYRGLWKIEESFKITKSYLKARPAFVHKEGSIEAHFLSCFVALLLLRLLEKRTNNTLSVKAIAESLTKAQLALLPNETYINVYCDSVINEIGKAMDLNLNRKYYSKGDLKALRGKTAKST